MRPSVQSHTNPLDKICLPGVLFLDVRDAKQYADRHPKDAYNCPFHTGNWAEELKESLPSDIEHIALFSPNPDDGLYAQKSLEKVGLPVVYHFDQGVEEWERRGLPVESVPTVAPEQVAEAGDYTVIDVREHHERERDGVIPGSHHIPMSSLAQAVANLRRDKKYAIVCHSGNRSAAATKRLQRHGFHAASVSGGVRQWKAQKLPISQ